MTRTPDMFDFLEDAGRKLDEASRDLAEREAVELDLAPLDRAASWMDGVATRELDDCWDDVS